MSDLRCLDSDGPMIASSFVQAIEKLGGTKKSDSQTGSSVDDIKDFTSLMSKVITGSSTMYRSKKIEDSKPSLQEVNDNFGSRICEKMDMLQGQYSKLPNPTEKLNPFKVQEHQNIPLDLESTSLEKHKGTKRKASDPILDLNLSLGVHSGSTESPKAVEEDHDDGEGEERNLSLSLYSPSFSRNRKKLITEDDHSNDQKAKRASTLDLTI
ncbi:unnamed protein product [Lactuca virosa]|uniref:Rab3 GTPase-activating protein catalytic subunit n=1 Tax=Lactuca virosa TaxID=75947 RepID=A0AAU9N9C3_9ASTR|nr:unnamed protein product [Lactuca virosa]